MITKTEESASVSVTHQLKPEAGRVSVGIRLCWDAGGGGGLYEIVLPRGGSRQGRSSG